jgi:hypothetical protein
MTRGGKKVNVNNNNNNNNNNNSNKKVVAPSKSEIVATQATIAQVRNRVEVWCI